MLFVPRTTLSRKPIAIPFNVKKVGLNPDVVDPNDGLIHSVYPYQVTSKKINEKGRVPINITLRDVKVFASIFNEKKSDISSRPYFLISVSPKVENFITTYEEEVTRGLTELKSVNVEERLSSSVTKSDEVDRLGNQYPASIIANLFVDRKKKSTSCGLFLQEEGKLKKIDLAYFKKNTYFKCDLILSQPSLYCKGDILSSDAKIYVSWTVRQVRVFPSDTIDYTNSCFLNDDLFQKSARPSKKRKKNTDVSSSPSPSTSEIILGPLGEEEEEESKTVSLFDYTDNSSSSLAIPISQKNIHLHDLMK